MPWQETHVMDERMKFVGKFMEGGVANVRIVPGPWNQQENWL